MLRTSLLDRPGVSHGFTTREGGVSAAPFDTLNLTAGRGDDPDAVAENLERVRNALDLEALVLARQVHGRTVLRVDRAEGPAGVRGEADALITDRPGIGLVVQAADCTPVLVLDPDRPAVAAVHAGWRGAVKDVPGAAVRALVRAYGSRTDRMLVAIGPSIGQARYRVGPEVLDAFREQLGDLDEELIGPLDGAGGATLDVGEAVRRRLARVGVREERIDRLAFCTYDDPRFFSSRRAGGGAFGGQAGVIGLSA